MDYHKWFDFFGALALLTISMPLVLCLAALIYFETGRPIFYLNERIGRNGKKFKLVKFREYYQRFCTDQEYPDSKKALALERRLIETMNQRKGSLYKILNDPRRSAVGRFIERRYLGELPNFWNVLRGEMSLVGPRPHQTRELPGIEHLFPERQTVKPGVTGLAQINGGSDLDTGVEFAYDREYIRRKSLGFDIRICLKTLPVILRAWF